MLPADTRDLVMNMAANNEEGDAIMERINTNAFLGNFQGETHFMMHPEEAVGDKTLAIERRLTDISL